MKLKSDWEKMGRKHRIRIWVGNAQQRRNIRRDMKRLKPVWIKASLLDDSIECWADELKQIQMLVIQSAGIPSHLIEVPLSQVSYDDGQRTAGVRL